MERLTWRAVDGSGNDLATGRPPVAGGAPSPAAALAAAPVVAWPLSVVGSDGSRLTPGQALGPGGDRVEHLLARVVGDDRYDSVDTARLAADTPLGPVQLPLAVLPLPQAVQAAADVDPAWLAAVERRRTAPRRPLVEAGRSAHLEAALHVAMLLAVDRFDPAHDCDADAHAASGAMLWLLAGAVAWALATWRPAPFASWAELVAQGMWPVGPSGGRLVLSAAHVGAASR